jgi:hypothetical protein
MWKKGQITLEQIDRDMARVFVFESRRVNEKELISRLLDLFKKATCIRIYICLNYVTLLLIIM